MRTRRTHRIGTAEAEQLVAGDHPGPSHAALRKLLDAAGAPATADELSGEKAAVAAFTAHRRSAARAARRTPARTRTAVVTITAGLALLSLTGTAVAARTGNLPQGAQQHAHRLFSALGVPAPRTGPPHPVPSSTPTITALTWCDAWRGGARSASPLSGDDRRRLVAAAGGEEAVDRYCAELRRSASASPSGRPASSSPSPKSAAPSNRPAPARTPTAGPGTGTPADTPPTATTPTATTPPEAPPTLTEPAEAPASAPAPNAVPPTLPSPPE